MNMDYECIILIANLNLDFSNLKGFPDKKFNYENCPFFQRKENILRKGEMPATSSFSVSQEHFEKVFFPRPLITEIMW